MLQFLHCSLLYSEHIALGKILHTFEYLTCFLLLFSGLNKDSGSPAPSQFDRSWSFQLLPDDHLKEPIFPGCGAPGLTLQTSPNALTPLNRICCLSCHTFCIPLWQILMWLYTWMRIILGKYHQACRRGWFHNEDFSHFSGNALAVALAVMGMRSNIKMSPALMLISKSKPCLKVLTGSLSRIVSTKLISTLSKPLSNS